MFERPASGNRAVLVQVDFGEANLADRVAELSLLANSAGAEAVALIQCKRQAPDAALFVGKGKAEEIAEAARETEADIVIFNHELAPGQQRNLERVLQRRVVDRNSLILDIFALRAKSHEGKLQVELAQLQHLSTRLVRGWTHLERQKGGIGLRGPGETQLETDRRLLGNRVAMLKQRLKGLEKQRRVRSRARERHEMPVVAMVGYTNAGKSTLFNALTKAGAYAANQLFATLDTTLRRVYLKEADRSLLVSDTVGFIRDLPHSVIAAFHATLEETANADLLLHVVDASSPEREAQMAVVDQVLEEIGAGAVPRIVIWNKIDATAGEPGVEKDAYGNIQRVLLSARTGAGLDFLRAALAETIFGASAPEAEESSHTALISHDERMVDPSSVPAQTPSEPPSESK